MQEEQFCFDIRLLQVGGCGLLLGMDRIDVFSSVVLSPRPHSLSFFKEDRLITLFGYQDENTLFPTEGEKLQKMFNKHLRGINVVCTMGSYNDDGRQQVPQEITVLLKSFQEVFEEPKELPPNRPCDHNMLLL